MVGWILGYGARWVLRPPRVVMLPVHGLWAGRVGWQAVVVRPGLVVMVVVVVVLVVVLAMVVLVLVVVVLAVLGAVVVVVVVVTVVLRVVVVVVVVVMVVVVLGVVVVVVLRVCPQGALAHRWDKGLGLHLQPLGLQGLVARSGGLRVEFDRARG